MDYKYSVILSSNPRVSLTLTKEEEVKFDSRGFIDLESKHAQVVSILTSPDVSELMLKCHPEHVLPSMLTEGSESYIQHAIGNISEGLVYICFTGAELISKAWMYSGIGDINSVDLSVLRHEEMSINQIEYLYGVYWIEIDSNIESHSFVLYLTQDKVVVQNTYGGFVGIFTTEWIRDDFFAFLKAFIKANPKAQMKNYHTLWGFTREMVESAVMYEWRKYMKKLVIDSLVSWKIF